jgi:hypothetical protein
MFKQNHKKMEDRVAKLEECVAKLERSNVKIDHFCRTVDNIIVDTSLSLSHIQHTTVVFALYMFISVVYDYYKSAPSIV